MEQAMQFPRGNIYLIVCKQGEQALRLSENDPKHYEKSRVCGMPPNQQDMGQLFMVEQTAHRADAFEIVNCLADLVFDEEGKEIRLKHGKRSKDQLFAMVPAPVQGFHPYFWIKCSEKGDHAIALEGIMRVKPFDPNAENQLFRLELVNNNPGLARSSMIINNLSGKALDVPGSSFKKEERINQWEINKRFNQRWIISKHGNGVIIQSLLNGLVLDVAGESKKPGAKVVQWDRTGNPNQVWIPEPQGNGVYRFRASHCPALFLGIDNQNVNDGGKLEIIDQPNPSTYWGIIGPQP